VLGTLDIQPSFSEDLGPTINAKNYEISQAIFLWFWYFQKIRQLITVFFFSSYLLLVSFRFLIMVRMIGFNCVLSPERKGQALPQEIKLIRAIFCH